MPTKVERRSRTHPLLWCSGIVCSLIAVAILLSSIAVFVGYMVIHPRFPIMSVLTAHLEYLHYHAVGGLLETQVTVVIRVENANSMVHASFSHTTFVLAFHGLKIAKLVAPPFHVSKNSTLDLTYVVHSSSVPVDAEVAQVLDTSLQRDEIIMFQLKGDSRTRWRAIPLLASLKFPCRFTCHLRFHPLNGSYIPSHCTSKSK